MKMLIQHIILREWFMARCTWYNIMWQSLSVTCDRSVVGSGTPVPPREPVVPIEAVIPEEIIAPKEPVPSNELVVLSVRPSVHHT
jgi:hypothetical protein